MIDEALAAAMHRTLTHLRTSLDSPVGAAAARHGPAGDLGDVQRCEEVSGIADEEPVPASGELAEAVGVKAAEDHPVGGAAAVSQGCAWGAGRRVTLRC